MSYTAELLMLFYQGLEQERSQHNSFRATVFEIGTEKCRLAIFYEEDCIADTFCLPHLKRMWKHETHTFFPFPSSWHTVSRATLRVKWGSRSWVYCLHSGQCNTICSKSRANLEQQNPQHTLLKPSKQFSGNQHLSPHTSPNCFHAGRRPGLWC